MNLIGRTLKITNWLLFGKDSKRYKLMVIKVAEHIIQGSEVSIQKDSIVIRHKRTFE